VTTTLTPPSVLSTAELAQRLQLRVEEVERLMLESQAMGIVIRSHDGWKLSSTAERCLGSALRGMDGR
jgi:hypothetical protein